jgi:hypothetical protein
VHGKVRDLQICFGLDIEHVPSGSYKSSIKYSLQR